jgi:hypothetical protein
MSNHAMPLGAPLSANFDLPERTNARGRVLAFTWQDADPSRILGYWVISPELESPHIQFIDAGALKSFEL